MFFLLLSLPKKRATLAQRRGLIEIEWDHVDRKPVHGPRQR